MVENAIQITCGITINVGVKIQENVMSTKNVLFGILALVLGKLLKI